MRGTAAADRTRLFLYPDDIEAYGPEALATAIAGLGFDAVSVALTYHRSRRILAGRGQVASLKSGGLAFRPGAGYGKVRPVGEAMAHEDDVLAFRSCLRRAGVEFGVWLVVLPVDGLASSHPDLTPISATGDRALAGLCPSPEESVRYADAIVRDVCERFGPDLIEAEGVLHPAWNPSFTSTITLCEVSPQVARLAAQCFCPACEQIGSAAGIDVPRVKALVADAIEVGLYGNAGPLVEDEVEYLLVRWRSRSTTTIVRAATHAAAATDTTVRVLGFGDPSDLLWQGLSPEAVREAPAIAFGHGQLTGAALAAHHSDLRESITEQPCGAILNWSPHRTPTELAADVAALAADGAQAIAVYNLSLVPPRAWKELSVVPQSWREGR